jgi:hypothetical protein
VAGAGGRAVDGVVAAHHAGGLRLGHAGAEGRQVRVAGIPGGRRGREEAGVLCARPGRREWLAGHRRANG